MSESLCPPPAKWIARSGFQPTNAAAKTGRGESRAASHVSASSASAASTLKLQAAACSEDPLHAATPCESTVNTGP
jgi:hypothetical protein